MKIKALSLAVSFIYLPIWLYYSYKILEHIEASEILWFIFVMLLPVTIGGHILTRLAEWED